MWYPGNEPSILAHDSTKSRAIQAGRGGLERREWLWNHGPARGRTLNRAFDLYDVNAPINITPPR